MTKVYIIMGGLEDKRERYVNQSTSVTEVTTCYMHAYEDENNQIDLNKSHMGIELFTISPGTLGL